MVRTAVPSAWSIGSAGCVLVSATALVSGCSMVLEADRAQCGDNRPCPTGYQCTAGVCVEAGRFACLGAQAPAAGESIDFAFGVSDFVTNETLPFAVAACPPGDVECQMPGPRVDGVLDESGYHYAPMTVSADSMGQVSPLLVFFAEGSGHIPVILEGRVAFYPLYGLEGGERVVEIASIDDATIEGGFVASVGDTVREGYAPMLLVDVERCVADEPSLQSGAEGLRILWPPELVEPGVTTAWYMRDGVPSNDVDMTDGSGIMGLFNARPGTGIVEVRDRSDGDRLLFRTRVVMRAGFKTYLILLPEVFPVVSD